MFGWFWVFLNRLIKTKNTVNPEYKLFDKFAVNCQVCIVLFLLLAHQKSHELQSRSTNRDHNRLI